MEFLRFATDFPSSSRSVADSTQSVAAKLFDGMAVGADVRTLGGYLVGFSNPFF